MKSLLAACVLFAASALAGCSSGVSTSGWQSGLEAYVTQQADNDMNTLRQSPEGAEGSLRRFGLLNGSNEAQGVLLGYQQMQGRPWYIYLVGVTKSRDIEDIHMMAVSRNPANPAEFAWVGGAADRPATSRYRSARLTAWRKGSLNSADEDTFEISFPAPDDVFSLSIAGDTATATDERSGAKWTLVFGEKTETTKAASR